MTDYYVDVLNGDDSYDGLAESFDQSSSGPKLHISAVLSLTGNTITEDTTIYLAGTTETPQDFTEDDVDQVITFLIKQNEFGGYVNMTDF